jgi:hypothetical protein
LKPLLFAYDRRRRGCWTTSARRPAGRLRFLLIDQPRETPQRQSVALRPQTRDDAIRAKRHVGMVAERLALVDIGNVHLEDWELARIQGVQNRDRRMRKCGWIDHDATSLLARFVDPVDDFIFAVMNRPGFAGGCFV